jgi:hypothetical protein
MRFLIAAIFMNSLPAAAADSQGQWEKVQRLKSSQKVKVYLRDGKVLKGRFDRAADESLHLLEGGKSVNLAKQDVTRVTKKSRGRGALWGGLISFGIAAPVGAYAGPYITDFGNPSAGTRFRHAMGWGMFIGGAGAGIGALVGMETTVYRAPHASGRSQGVVR